MVARVEFYTFFVKKWGLPLVFSNEQSRYLSAVLQLAPHPPSRRLCYHTLKNITFHYCCALLLLICTVLYHGCFDVLERHCALAGSTVTSPLFCLKSFPPPHLHFLSGVIKILSRDLEREHGNSLFIRMTCIV